LDLGTWRRWRRGRVCIERGWLGHHSGGLLNERVRIRNKRIVDGRRRGLQVECGKGRILNQFRVWIKGILEEGDVTIRVGQRIGNFDLEGLVRRAIVTQLSHLV
jgi:hypothetical protein